MTDREILELASVKEATKEVIEARQRVIAGKTWLVVQLMQGARLLCHHSEKRHFAEIGGKVVTEVHSSEIGLAGELFDHHDLEFRQLNFSSSIGDMQNLTTEWIWS